MPVLPKAIIIGLIVMLIILGTLIKYFKCYNLISGYNTASREEKAAIDIVAVSKVVGNLLYVIALIMLVAFAFGLYGNNMGLIVTMLLLLPTITVGLIIVGKRSRVKVEAGDKKVVYYIPVIFLLVITVMVGSMLFIGSREPKIVIDNNYITVQRMYSTKIAREEVLSVELRETMPKVLNKENGFDLGNILRGRFKLEGFGSTMIYVHKDKSPFIFIKTQNSVVIINSRNKDMTEELYNKLRSELANKNK